MRRSPYLVATSCMSTNLRSTAPFRYLHALSAVQAADNAGGSSTISVPSNTYNLTLLASTSTGGVLLTAHPLHHLFWSPSASVTIMGGWRGPNDQSTPAKLPTGRLPSEPAPR